MESLFDLGFERDNLFGFEIWVLLGLGFLYFLLPLAYLLLGLYLSFHLLFFLAQHSLIHLEKLGPLSKFDIGLIEVVGIYEFEEPLCNLPLMPLPLAEQYLRSYGVSQTAGQLKIKLVVICSTSPPASVHQILIHFS